MACLIFLWFSRCFSNILICFQNFALFPTFSPIAPNTIHIMFPSIFQTISNHFQTTIQTIPNCLIVPSFLRYMSFNKVLKPYDAKEKYSKIHIIMQILQHPIQHPYNPMNQSKQTYQTQSCDRLTPMTTYKPYDLNTQHLMPNPICWPPGHNRWVYINSFYETCTLFKTYFRDIVGQDFVTCLGSVWKHVERLLETFREGF